MTRCIAFRTPGLIPLESFTTFGVNVKPNSTSPFGYFGTGLKYAIAVLLRTGHRVVLWRGEHRYEFYVKKEDFRGKEFAFVRMKRSVFNIAHGLIGGVWPRRDTYEKLPFTTELGKNWELWQAFRELETNTRDEGGDTTLLEMSVDELCRGGDETLILVFGDKFVDEFLDMDRHFLRDGKRVREDEAVQVIDRPSKQIYYRGVRVMDLKEEAEFTYNILSSLDLTEDRTVKYQHQVEQIIATYFIEKADEDQVRRGLTTSRWESRGINYGYAWATPSAAFRSHASTAKNPTAREFLEQHDPSVPTRVTVQLSIPRPEVTENELADVVRAVAETLGLFDLTATNMSTQDMVSLSDITPEQSELVC